MIVTGTTEPCGELGAEGHALFDDAKEEGLKVVKTLAMPTCNRVEFAGRSLRTFIENSVKFDLECDYVLYDDSLSPQTRDGYRAMLKKLREEFGVPVFYAGLEEKVSFVKELLSGGELPPETVKFSIFDIYKHRASTLGGNRNAVMLDNPGRAFVSVDDDTFCRISRLPDATNRVEAVTGDAYSVSDPCEFVSFADRKQLLDSLSYTDAPYLQIHDRVLGKTMAEFDRDGKASGRSSGKVLISFNGLAGDCTWAPLTSYVYFFVTGSSLSKLISSAAAYDAARASREIVRVSRQVYLTPISASPGAFFAMDNRELLPPFMPPGGAEDNFYWETKRKCFPDDFFAHLPWALLHEPPGGRTFRPDDMRRSRQGSDFYSIAMAFVRSLPKASDSAVPDRLAKMGKEFEAMGALNLKEFEETIKELLRLDVQRIKDRLEEKLEENAEACDLWREDLKCFLRDSWSIVDHPDVAVPVDFMCLRSREEALKLAQTLISQFGRLLAIWPQMMQAAADLQKKGIRLAKAI